MNKNRFQTFFILIILGIGGCTLNEPPYVILPDGKLQYVDRDSQLRDKDHEPANYDEYVSSRIKKQVFEIAQRKNLQEEGIVHVTVWLSAKGRIKYVLIDDETSTDSNRLRHIVKQAVYDARPYKSFPKELKKIHPDKEFKVAINFVVKKMVEPSQE